MSYSTLLFHQFLQFFKFCDSCWSQIGKRGKNGVVHNIPTSSYVQGVFFKFYLTFWFVLFRWENTIFLGKEKLCLWNLLASSLFVCFYKNVFTVQIQEHRTSNSRSWTVSHSTLVLFVHLFCFYSFFILQIFRVFR